MAYQTLQQEYLQIPVVTRAYTTACVLTTAAVVRSTTIPSDGTLMSQINFDVIKLLAIERGRCDSVSL